jgi:hypothetical protein
MFVEVISDDREIKDFCYEPLKSGDIYKATFENKYYMRVFFFINDEEYDIVVHERHLRTLDLDEIRDFKLNNLGI